ATEIKLSAVGDILMIGPIIRFAKLSDTNRYDFAGILDQVTPYLRGSDLVIGNLETPLAGNEIHYTQKNRRTGFSMFNCPDDLAPALKSVGFDVLITGNNHALDRGEAGLNRTLRLLDEHGLAHTGTFSQHPGMENHLIKEIKGIRVGIVSYSKSTNKLPLPAGKPWMVNVVDRRKPQAMLDHVRRLSKQVDLVVVCLHTGTEYIHYPPKEQRELVRLLFNCGAHIILGSHPHVIQPNLRPRKDQFVIHSLGNFISTRLHHNPYTNLGVILELTVKKDDRGEITISEIVYVPTWSTQIRSYGRIKYKLLPIKQNLSKPFPKQSADNYNLMVKMWKHANHILKGTLR
ncbi:MAG: CapA family protein, partial [Gorillibacterium sp.]|nr:CapA family protein [Gorillibacterium sp.]